MKFKTLFYAKRSGLQMLSKTIIQDLRKMSVKPPNMVFDKV